MARIDYTKDLENAKTIDALNTIYTNIPELERNLYFTLYATKRKELEGHAVQQPKSAEQPKEKEKVPGAPSFGISTTDRNRLTQLKNAKSIEELDRIYKAIPLANASEIFAKEYTAQKARLSSTTDPTYSNYINNIDNTLTLTDETIAAIPELINDFNPTQLLSYKLALIRYIQKVGPALPGLQYGPFGWIIAQANRSIREGIDFWTGKKGIFDATQLYNFEGTTLKEILLLGSGLYNKEVIKAATALALINTRLVGMKQDKVAEGLQQERNTQVTQDAIKLYNDVITGFTNLLKYMMAKPDTEKLNVAKVKPYTDLIRKKYEQALLQALYIHGRQQWPVDQEKIFAMIDNGV